MKKIMWMFALTAGLMMGLAAATPKGWEADFAAAKKVATEKKRPMLLLFTGSDWCPYCIQLERNVLSQNAFQKFATEKLVLVFLDFPRRTQLPPAQRKANETLASQYRIEGFPTVVLTDAAGKEFKRLGYSPSFMKELEEAVEAWEKKSAADKGTDAGKSGTAAK